MFTFRTDMPSVSDLGSKHGRDGNEIEALMQHPAYLDAMHPQHEPINTAVRLSFEGLYGDDTHNAGPTTFHHTFQT